MHAISSSTAWEYPPKIRENVSRSMSSNAYMIFKSASNVHTSGTSCVVKEEELPEPPPLPFWPFKLGVVMEPFLSVMVSLYSVDVLLATATVGLTPSVPSLPLAPAGPGSPFGQNHAEIDTIPYPQKCRKSAVSGRFFIFRHCGSIGRTASLPG